MFPRKTAAVPARGTVEDDDSGPWVFPTYGSPPASQKVLDVLTELHDQCVFFYPLGGCFKGQSTLVQRLACEWSRQNTGLHCDDEEVRSSVALWLENLRQLNRLH